MATGGTEACCLHRLVCTLPAEAHLEAIANQGLTRVGDDLGVRDQVHHGAADDKNPCCAHVRRISFMSGGDARFSPPIGENRMMPLIALERTV
jgi:hypothetical protein